MPADPRDEAEALAQAVFLLPPAEKLAAIREAFSRIAAAARAEEREVAAKVVDKSADEARGLCGEAVRILRKEAASRFYEQEVVLRDLAARIRARAQKEGE